MDLQLLLNTADTNLEYLSPHLQLRLNVYVVEACLQRLRSAKSKDLIQKMKTFRYVEMTQMIVAPIILPKPM